ncbi:MAG: diacylglycerol kinase family protein [Paracoccus sp. (in: a-proteobacteria)]|uniref:diacylglycerol/lipid kinase family protein n=1 Tax=Paracoccus sp. TaxID=267 RepID=UPI0026DED31E|nr:diacylglycerol kinase family protein [Paracoccus sp. (in: a-proteobacteria)]MDO5612966.1 diacylglycerol kinase family protein [Paracoccus sp. (in: a-proteobacteria)]
MPDPTTPFDLSRARVCVILNAGSGKQSGDDIAILLERELAPRAAEFSLIRTARGDDLPRLARQAVSDGFSLIVAVGGDGTQSAIAGALTGSDVVMGVIPGGTFNYFARDLGVGETPEQALETLLGGRTGRIHVGTINGQVFLNNVSFGAYPDILKQREDIYRRWGRSRIAAYWSVIVALRNLRRPMRLTVGERVFTTALAFVANNRLQMEQFDLDGKEAIEAGKFALMIAHASRPWPLIGAALRLAFGRSARGSDFDLIVTDQITIETRPARQLVAHDGEKSRMDGPFRLQVHRNALTVLLPAASQDQA